MASEQKIIQDLDKAFSGLTVTLETLQKVLAQNKASQQEQIQYIESLKKAIGDSKEWRAFADATAKVTDAQKELTKQQKDALDIAKKEEQLKQQQIRTTEAARKAQEAQTKSGEKANKQKQDSLSLYKQETDRLRELTKQAKEAAIAYGIGSKEARKLTKEQQELDRKIKAVDASLGIHNRNVGHYERALNGAKGMISKVTGFLGGFGLALGAGATVMKSFQMLVNSSQTAGDKWAISVGGMKGAIEGFFQASGTGNLDGIADAMERGARAGREYAAAIDDLFEGAQGVKILTAEYDLQIAQQERIRRDVTKTNDERKKAALEIVRLERLKLDVINTENDKTFKAEAQRTGLNEEDLISFLKTYREKESIRNAYFEEEKRLNDEIQKNIEKTTVSMGQFGGTQTVFTETPASKKARENLATFIAAQSADMKIYLDLIDRYGGTTDEMVTKFTDAYVAITNAQTKSIDEQRKNNAFLAQSEKELNETKAETISTTNDLIKIQEELLRQANEMPGTTEDEIAARNKKIQVIDAEIKRLKDLGKLQAPEQLKAISEDDILSDAEKAREELDKINDQELADWIDKEQQKTEITKQYAQEREELQKEINDQLGELFGEAGNAFFEVENEKYEKSIEANTAYYDSLLANEKFDEEQRSLLEAQKKAKENEIKKRQRENEKKQFLFNQGMRIAEIWMAAAQGIATATAMAPATYGASLLSIPLIKLSAAVQTGIVLAQSIPQFDKGTESAPDKFIAGEKRPEIMVDKQGNATMVDRPTLFVGKQFEGNQIISGSDTAKMLANAGNITNAMLLKA
jgi:hypothetical protein